MIERRAQGAVVLFATVLAVTLIAGPARGQDQQIPRVGEVVDVIDASDGDDRFDFTFRAGYSYTLTRVKITQQCPAGTAAEFGCVPGESGVIAFRDVGRYNHFRHVLNLEAVFGLYRDLHVYTGWPIILQDQRELLRLDDNPHTDYPGNNRLLRFPFHAVDRFGVDQFTLGLSWLPFSQERNATLPTWLVNIEGQFAIGEQMQPACRESNGNVQVRPEDEGQVTGFTCPTDGGISERHHDVVLRMTLSRRFGIVEPYIGFMTEIEFPEESDAQRYGHGGYNYPIYAEAHFGLEVVPWERDTNQQYFRLGIHLWGGWNREVLDYGPLYDVLGTNPYMRYRFDPGNPTEFGSPQNFTGLTRIEGHGTFGGRLTLTLQVARYVKFDFGASIAHDQEHFITFSDQCRLPRGGETGSATGPDNRYDCLNNPDTIFVEEWRPQIDRVGRRFRAEETTIFQAFVNVNVQF